MNRKMSALISAAAVTSALVFGVSTAANAVTPDGPAPVGYHRYTVVDHTSTTYYKGSQLLAACTAYNVALTCTIAQGKSATRTIGLDFSATRGDIAASLNISASSSVDTTVSCSGKINPGQRWGAWPVGTHHKYHVRDQYIQSSNGAVLNTTIGSSYKYAFNPYASVITCGTY